MKVVPLILAGLAGRGVGVRTGEDRSGGVPVGMCSSRSLSYDPSLTVAGRAGHP